MLDIKYLRKNKKEVIKKLSTRGVSGREVENALNAYEKAINIEQDLEKERHALNEASKKKDIKKGKKAKIRIKKLERSLKRIGDFRKSFYLLPNLPLGETPISGNESKNKVIKEVKGRISPFNFKPKDYLTLAEELDLIDIERAAKVSGSRFGYLKNEAVILEFALVGFVLDTLVKEGFIPVVPPVMLKEKPMQAMGYIDHGRDEIYHLEKDNLFLVGTAEQSLGGMHQDEVLSKKNLPLRYIGFSTCFRREAGSYGKDTKGILRVHQFDKLEMFIFCQPKDSKKEHQNLVSLQEKMVQALQIPYRLIEVSKGDLAAPSARTVDLEMWMPGQNEYRETHSASNCTDYQARRLKTRFRDEKGKTELVYTLNATAFAIGRTLIAIIENYQQEDGSVKIPEALQKYTSGLKVIKK